MPVPRGPLGPPPPPGIYAYPPPPPSAPVAPSGALFAHFASTLRLIFYCTAAPATKDRGFVIALAEGQAPKPAGLDEGDSDITIKSVTPDQLSKLFDRVLYHYSKNLICQNFF